MKKKILWIFPIPAQVEASKKMNLEVFAIYPQFCLNAKQQSTKDKSIQLVDHSLEFDSNLSAEDILAIMLKEFGQNFDYIDFSGNETYHQLYLDIASRLGKLKNPLKIEALFLDKSCMRNYLKNNPAFSIRYQVLQSVEELQQQAFLFGLPFILKPTQSTGSTHIRLVQNQDDLQQVLKDDSENTGIYPLIMEEVLNGVQYSVEAISVGGKHEIIGFTEKFEVKPPHFIEVGGVFPAPLSSQEQAQLEQLIQEFLTATGFQFGFTHTEFFFDTNNKKMAIVESHSRQGGMLPDLVHLALGYDVFEQYLSAMVGKNYNFQPREKMMAMIDVYQFESGGIAPVIKSDDIQHSHLKKISFQLKSEEIIPTVTNNGIRHGVSFLQAHSYEHLWDARKEVRQQIEEKWGTPLCLL